MICFQSKVAPESRAARHPISFLTKAIFFYFAVSLYALIKVHNGQMDISLSAKLNYYSHFV